MKFSPTTPQSPATPKTAAPARKAPKLKNYVSWFEIPATDAHRSANFYNEIYGINMEVTEINGYRMALFPAEKGIGGAIVSGEGSVPGSSGPLIYLNGGKDLNTILSRVGTAGGRVILPKTLINESVGYFALFIDTEGNKMALHSKQ